MAKQNRKPTAKQLRWCDAFADCLNKTEATRRAGYGGSETTIRSIGHRNFENPNLQSYLKEAMKRRKMPDQDWIIEKLRDVAEVDLGDFTEIIATNSPADVLKRAKKAGLSHLIRKVKFGAHGLEVEFHDRVRALEILARHMITTKQEVEHTVGAGVMLVPATPGAEDWDTYAKQVAEKQREMTA